MKYLVVLGDGMADYPIECFGGKTPLEYANTPNIDRLAPLSEIGLVKTVPNGMKPGSDVANLSVIGYAPEKYYSGRSPLEALSIGVDMLEGDVAVRTNLVTLSDEEDIYEKTMVDYSAGEISTAEATELIKAVKEGLNSEEFSVKGHLQRHTVKGYRCHQTPLQTSSSLLIRMKSLQVQL